MASNSFNVFASFVNRLNVVQHNLPEDFMDRGSIEIIRNPTDVSYAIDQEKVEGDVYKTILRLVVKHDVKFVSILDSSPGTQPGFTIELEYVSFTMIQDADSIAESDKKEILMVDVPLQVFPSISSIISYLTAQMKRTPFEIPQPDRSELLRLIDDQTYSTDDAV